MSGLGLYTQLPPNEEAAQHLLAMNPDCMVLVDEALPWARWLPDIYYIFRPYGLLPDNYQLPESPALCYREGRRKAEAVLQIVRNMPGVRGLVSLNERHPQNEADAKRVGAFVGGFSNIVCPAGYDHHAFNWSAGYDHHDLVVAAWAEAISHVPVDCRNRVILAYHAYTQTTKQVDAPYFELRPWAYWRRLFGFANLAWPRISLTECGFDDRRKAPNNGWRHNLSEQEYADYLRRLLYLTSDAFCRVIFGWRLLNAEPHPWVDMGFEVEGAELVERTISNINGVPTPRKEDPMPEMLDDERLLRDAWRRMGVEGFPPTNAFWRYCLAEWHEKGRFIVPMPSPDGNFEVHSLPNVIVAYMQPVLWIRKGDATWTVHEGNPFLA